VKLNPRLDERRGVAVGSLAMAERMLEETSLTYGRIRAWHKNTNKMVRRRLDSNGIITTNSNNKMNVLKGNYTLEQNVGMEQEKPAQENETVVTELRKKALASLGGSMVYMERSKLSWDGDQQGGTGHSGQ
jgi:lipopolysaccharide export LptBFGC system permease protein LptF